jgi:hypothetical protein
MFREWKNLILFNLILSFILLQYRMSTTTTQVEKFIVIKTTKTEKHPLIGLLPECPVVFKKDKKVVESFGEESGSVIEYPLPESFDTSNSVIKHEPIKEGDLNGMRSYFFEIKTVNEEWKPYKEPAPAKPIPAVIPKKALPKPVLAKPQQTEFKLTCIPVDDMLKFDPDNYRTVDENFFGHFIKKCKVGQIRKTLDAINGRVRDIVAISCSSNMDCDAPFCTLLHDDQKDPEYKKLLNYLISLKNRESRGFERLATILVRGNYCLTQLRFWYTLCTTADKRIMELFRITSNTFELSLSAFLSTPSYGCTDPDCDKKHLYDLCKYKSCRFDACRQRHV